MGERLTTAQAERRSGASRWALARARKAGDLWAEQDNRGRWCWDGDALDRWAALRPVEPLPIEAAPKPAETRPEAQAVEGIAAALMEARERAARAEGERDGLRVALDQANARATAAEARAVAAESETARLREAAERRGWGMRWLWRGRAQ